MDNQWLAVATQKTQILLDMLPSGKDTQNYGNTSLLIGKTTINWSFSIAMLDYQRVYAIGLNNYQWINNG